MGHQFKVGDRVRLLEDEGEVKRGAEGMVTAVHPGHDWPYEVAWPGHPDFIHSADELELVDPPKPPTPFDIGARVRAKRDLIGGKIPRGALGVVVGSSPDGELGIRAVRFEGHPCPYLDRPRGEWHLYIGLLEADDTPEPSPAPAAPTSTFEHYGTGLQSLLAFTQAFQEIGEEKFEFTWSLCGKSLKSSAQAPKSVGLKEEVAS